MEKSAKEIESFQAMEEFKIVEKKLKRANETLKPFTIEQIRQAAAKAQEEKV